MPNPLNNLAASNGPNNVIEQNGFRAFLESPVSSGTESFSPIEFMLFDFNGNNALRIESVTELNPGIDIFGLA
jgi:hypothetical protein